MLLYVNGMSICAPFLSFGALLLQHENAKPTPAKSKTTPKTGLTISIFMNFYLQAISMIREHDASDR
jgi:hypothetical protein